MVEFQVNKKRVAKNTIALYFRMAITMVISFFTSRVILEQLGVEDYGLNNLVGSIVSLLGFINGSIGQAIQRFYSIEIGKGEKGDLKRVFSTGLFLHIWIALITVLLLEILAVFFLHKLNIPADRMTAAQIVFQISVVQFAISILSVPYASMLRAREFFDKLAVLEVLQSFARLGVLYLLVHINYDKLISLSFLNLGVSLLYSGCIVFLALKNNKETHAKPSKDREILKQIFAFVSMLILSSMTSLCKTKGLVVLINLFFGLAINAAYAVAVQVSHIMNNFVLNFKSAMVPQMVSSYGSGDIVTMHKFINFGTKITGLMMLLLSLPVIFESQFLLTIWLKTPPQYAAELVSLVIININISQLTYFHYQGIQATGKITLNQTILTIFNVLAIVAYYLAFKLGASFYSAMYINFVISILIVTNGLVFSKRLYDYNVNSFLKRIVLRLVLIASFTVLTLTIICHYMAPSIVRAVVVFCVSSLLLIGLGWYVLLDRSERVRLLILIKRRQ